MYVWTSLNHCCFQLLYVFHFSVLLPSNCVLSITTVPQCNHFAHSDYSIRSDLIRLWDFWHGLWRHLYVFELIGCKTYLKLCWLTKSLSSQLSMMLRARDGKGRLGDMDSFTCQIESECRVCLLHTHTQTHCFSTHMCIGIYRIVTHTRKHDTILWYTVFMLFSSKYHELAECVLATVERFTKMWISHENHENNDRVISRGTRYIYIYKHTQVLCYAQRPCLAHKYICGKGRQRERGREKYTRALTYLHTVYTYTHGSIGIAEAWWNSHEQSK